MTLAAEADPLAVVDAGRDRHLEAPLLEHAARALALRARRQDLPPRAAALRARLRADELADRLGAVAAAVRAHHGYLERDLARGALRRLDEVELDGGGEVGAA